MADDANYRLRPLLTTKSELSNGAPQIYGESQSAWSSDLRTKTTDEVWVDDDDQHRSITHYTYEPTGNVATMTNARGKVTSYTYDARDLFVSVDDRPTDADDYEYKYEYGTGAKVWTRGPQWAWCHIYPILTCPAGAKVKNERVTNVDALGRVVEVQDAVNADPGLYDFALKRTELNEYDDRIDDGDPNKVTHYHAIDEQVNGTRFTKESSSYDGHGRVIEKRLWALGDAAADQVTSFHYNPEGTLHDVTVPDPTTNDATTVAYSYGFDSLGRATSIRRPDSLNPADRSGVDISYNGTIKVSAEVVGVAGGIAASTRTQSDAFGRLVEVDEQLTTTPTWATTTYGYSADDNVRTITDPEGHVTILTHDRAGHRTAITRGTRTWSYGYDADGNMISESSPSACAATDSTCLLKYVTSIAYDDLDRVSSKVIAPRELSDPDLALFGSSSELFQYDYSVNGTGRLSKWFSYAPNTSQFTVHDWFNFAPDGQEIQRLQYFQGAGFSQNYWDILHEYYLGGQLWSTRYRDCAGDGGCSSRSWYDYDARGLVSDVWITTDGIHWPYPPTVNTRNVAGLVTKQRTEGLPGAMSFIESNWTYDKLGRVTSQQIQKSGPAQVAREDLTYFGNDDPSSLSQWLGTDQTQLHFGFDRRHQLTGVSESVLPNAFTASYAYGDAGRFKHATEAAATLPGSEVIPRDVEYHYGGDDPEEVTSLTQGVTTFATYEYDLAGNMTRRTYPGSGDSWDFVYDGKDQLRRATKLHNGIPAGSEEYWYGSDGKRNEVVHRDASGTATELVWFLEDLEEHFDTSWNATRAYSHVTLGTPIARIDRTSSTSADIEYQFHGLGNSTLAAVDQASGTVNASFRYAPFGEVFETAGSAASTLAHKRRFNDKQQDELTTLVYYGARYYDKTLLGWTQNDPAYRFRPDAAWNSPRRSLLYTADLNNPLRYLDPDGRDAGALAAGGAGLLSEGAGALLGAASTAGLIGIGIASAIIVGKLMADNPGNYSFSMPDRGGGPNVQAINRTLDQQRQNREQAVATYKTYISEFDKAASQSFAKSKENLAGRKPGPNVTSGTRLGTAGGPSGGKKVTRADKEKLKDDLRAKSDDGEMRCEECDRVMVPSTRSGSGVTPPGNEIQADHIMPVAGDPPGDGALTNVQGTCRDCNRANSNTPK